MILITGATGTVGSEVVKRLSVQRAVARSAESRDESAPERQFVQGDFEDVDSIRCAEGAQA
jgi:uncharacterized protein YbjT (DUF2867 family)